MRIVERTVGIGHFLFDQVPSHIAEVPPKPRKLNPWLKDGKPVVSKINTDDNIRQCVERVLSPLGPLSSIISRGDNVMVKPNFNSDDSPPASTDLNFLKAVLEILLESGAKVSVGESSGGIWRPTSNVFRRLHLHEFARNLGVKLVSFEDPQNEWVKIIQ